jgi:uncharacterized protein YndB with AHSA1/START domain
VQPVTASITIARPREEVFAYLADIANHPEFSDHYLKDWRLTRVDSFGQGAGARYKLDAPFQRFGWADVTFTEVQAPYRIVGIGRYGKFNRNRTYTEWTLHPSGGGTRVDVMTETEPALATDRFVEAFGLRGWFRRNTGKALRRLRSILEEDGDRGARATVAGTEVAPYAVRPH